jgi:hypothetical protein
MLIISKKTLSLGVIQLMIALAFTFLLTPTARLKAEFSPTLDSMNISPAALEQLRIGLENKTVVNIFESLGYDDLEIQARMQGLDPSEISLLAGELQNSMVPSGDGTTLLILGGVALVLLIILGFIILKNIIPGR